MQPDRLKLKQVAQWLRDGREQRRVLGVSENWRAYLRQRRSTSRA
jgi:hypothetical protein